MKPQSTLVLLLGLGLAAGFVATPAVMQGTDAILKQTLGPKMVKSSSKSLALADLARPSSRNKTALAPF